MSFATRSIGFDIAKNDPVLDYDCYTLHDIDLYPENEAIVDYHCKDAPARHLTGAVKKDQIKGKYRIYTRKYGCFGGVAQITEKAFEEINGMSNLFWGWGGEDDNLAVRVGRKYKTRVIYENDKYKYAIVASKYAS